jgi:hypothetical protein
MTFEGKRAGYAHRYELTPTGLSYSAGSKTLVDIPWSELKSLRTGRSGSLYLVPRRGSHQKLEVWLEGEEMRRFLAHFFEAWGKIDRPAAAKASFDYVADHKTIGWLWIAMSLLFAGMLAMLLLADAYNTLGCNKHFEAGAFSAVPAQVTKVKKDKRGSVVWTLAFTSADGVEHKGKRPAFVFDEKGNPVGDVKVLVANADSSCWEVPVNAEGNRVNMSQRKFSMQLSMMFGWVFVVITALGVAAGIARLRRKLPYRETIEMAAQRLISAA